MTTGNSHSRPPSWCDDASERREERRIEQAFETVRDALWAERASGGYWIGELSSSALATATAVSAISLMLRPGGAAEQPADSLQALSVAGLRWLAAHQNQDGGWGDTTLSQSNISTTMLVRAAFGLAGAEGDYSQTLDGAIGYIERQGGAAAVAARYGKDRTFAVPILVNCALAGQTQWSEIARLPFELACLPHSWFRFLRLHVVSYALPALIAIGQLIHARRPSWNPITRALRGLAGEPASRKLESIQPASGGFLEAVPLTSFVVMSLAALGHGAHPVATRGLQFIADSARADGSWPIDSNLSVWLTTLSVNALAIPGQQSLGWPDGEAGKTASWLLEQQVRSIHPYTQAEPGGWGWSHLSGSVPDVDDTSGALLALTRLQSSDGPSYEDQVGEGLGWLLSLQNRDGGWPTFCSGWGKLPFDRSGADLTAHALRALAAWTNAAEDIGSGKVGPHHVANRSTGSRHESSPSQFASLQSRALRARNRALWYLKTRQLADGSWLPLWFGNEHMSDQHNPTYGTSRVLEAYRDLGLLHEEPARRGINWLLAAQNADGGWGGGPGIPSTIEETALAVCALSAHAANASVRNSARGGIHWLVERVESADWRNPSPIGLYFAKLWYYEKLYPLIFLVAALARARLITAPRPDPTPMHGG